jgi:hypothetical protein
MSERTTAGKVQIWLSPKAARFAANACRMMADTDLDDENDKSYYRIIAGVIDDVTEADPRLDALVRASGHTKADAVLILNELNRIGWTARPITGLPPITPSSGCVFFDLSVPCEQDGCVVCPGATPGASTPSAAPTTHPDPLDASCACGEGTLRGCAREPGVGCGAWRED